MNDEPITEAGLLAQLEQARGRIKSLEIALADANRISVWAQKAMYNAEAHVKELESQVAERAAALCQSCPLLTGSADLLGVIIALRLQRMEAEANDELHKRAAVTLGKFYLSAQTRQALDNVRTCEYEERGS